MPSLPNWSSPLRRQPGWERGYVATVDHHLQKPFEWGVSDCLILPADLCEAMCGRQPFPPKLRRYTTALGAAKLMAKLGFETVEDALANFFPPVSRLSVRRGDCGVYEQQVDGKPVLSAMIVLGDHSAVGKGENGIVRVDVSRLRSTFAIGEL
jgi:hypothetical protein